MEITSVLNGVLQYLRDKIITGELIAGQKLNEANLASEFNISRPPLREAFRILEQERLAVSIPRKGCYVTTISVEDLEQVYQGRLMIECYAFDILKEKKIKETNKISSDYEVASGGDPSRLANTVGEERLKYLRTLADFHTKLVEATQNCLLIHFHKTITYNLARYQYLFPYSAESFQRSQNHHKEILGLMRIGAYDQAKDCLRTHLITFKDILKDKMEGEALGKEEIASKVASRL